MNDDKIFQSLLSFIRTNPMVLLNAVAAYYEQFNVPAPTKDQLRQLMIKDVCKEDQLTEQQISQVKNAVDFNLGYFFD